jgi:nitrite reductase/ring-hydroxylating ferredoxin subunit
MPAFVKVASIGDLTPGRTMKMYASGKTIVLCNRDGNYYAIEDACPHRDGPCSEGSGEGNVTYASHGSELYIRTGVLLAPPADSGVTNFRVRVTGTDVEVEL